MWRALVGLGWLGSGCLVLHADTRENPGGKNGVMTVTQAKSSPIRDLGCYPGDFLGCRHAKRGSPNQAGLIRQGLATSNTPKKKVRDTFSKV